jgi:hypothetical protein
VAYDEALADRIRTLLGRRKGITERRMMGGLTFLCDGRMCGGVLGRDLVARVKREDMDSVLAQPHVRRMDFTGRPLAGFVHVAPAALGGDDDLRAWLDRGLAVARAGASSATPRVRRLHRSPAAGRPTP